MNRWDEIFNKGTEFSVLNEVFLDTLLLKIKEKIGRGPKTVIDLGCGTGDSLVKFAKRGFDVIGVDFSQVALSKAKALLEKEGVSNVVLQLADLNNLTGTINGKFDIVFCKLTYAFVDNKEDFLGSVIKMMNDDSVFVLMTPVLHKGIQYLKEDKPGIAVDFEETKALLNKYFGSVEVFGHDYFANKGDLTTFLLTK